MSAVLRTGRKNQLLSVKKDLMRHRQSVPVALSLLHTDSEEDSSFRDPSLAKEEGFSSPKGSHTPRTRSLRTLSTDNSEGTAVEFSAEETFKCIKSPKKTRRARSKTGNPISKKKVVLPYDTYMKIASELFTAMGLDTETIFQLEGALKSSKDASRVGQQAMCTKQGLKCLTNIEKNIKILRKDQKKHKAAIQIQSLIRMVQQRKAYEKMREKYIPERVTFFQLLCIEEKDFVMNLASLMSYYITPLRNTQDKHLKKVAAGLEKLFVDIETVMEVHQTFLKSLYELPRKSWPELKGLGNLFIYVSPHWRVYGSYVQHYTFALTTLDKVASSSHFNDFLEARSQLSENSGNFMMLLSHPLNHISKYHTFLKFILDTIPEDEAEYSTIQETLSITTEASNFVGNELVSAKNISTIRLLRKTLLPSPDTEEFFVRLSGTNAKFVKKYRIHSVQSGVSGPKKKGPVAGQLYVFNNVACITAMVSKGELLKQIYDLEHAVIETHPTKPKEFVLYSMHEQLGEYKPVPSSKKSIECEDELEELVKELRGWIALNQRNRTFGIPLLTLVERDCQDDFIPIFVKDIVRYMEEHCMHSVGLFRISGTATTINQLKYKYNQCNGEYPDLAEEKVQPNEIAGLFKLFFHDLPEPLIPATLYPQFISLVSTTEELNPIIFLEKVKILLDQIPVEPKAVLEYIISFLVRVAAVEENKMGAKNLATCFGTNILRPAEQTIESALAMPKANLCIEFIISYYEILFSEPVKEKPRVRRRTLDE